MKKGRAKVAVGVEKEKVAERKEVEKGCTKWTLWADMVHGEAQEIGHVKIRGIMMGLTHGKITMV